MVAVDGIEDEDVADEAVFFLLFLRFEDFVDFGGSGCTDGVVVPELSADESPDRT
jgi:hypothetical protein